MVHWVLLYTKLVNNVLSCTGMARTQTCIFGTKEGHQETKGGIEKWKE
jgi:hypothetical protein